MRITLNITNPESNDQDDILTLEIAPDTPLSLLRESIHAETQIQPTSQHLYHNGFLISPDKDPQTMTELGIADNDMLAVHVRDMRGSAGLPDQSRRAQRRQAASAQDPELIRLRILGDPRLRAQVQHQHPALAAALEDSVQFASIFTENYERERAERDERQRQIARLNEDPCDEDSQKKIEEMIREDQVTENLQNALEYNPEVFGRVHMLYVDVEVNGHKVKALVDSGAQATIMSPKCAQDCGIMRLVDTRFSGIAKGVGTANIIGRVHSAQIKIGTLFLPCGFTVMEGKAVELLLGLDMLKRHQAVIDLAQDKLIIQGTEVPFLGEADIPKESEEAFEEEPTLPGPSGMTIGQRSGVVTGPSSGSRRQATPAAPSPRPAADSNPSAAASAPAPAEAGTPGAPATSASPAAPAIPEDSVKQLTDLGFPRQAAIDALQATGGNVEFAAGLLFGA